MKVKASGKTKFKCGQAMVEFVIAIFAVVVIIAGLTDFIVLASRHSDIVADIRGKVGGRAVQSESSDTAAVMPDVAGGMPHPETSEAELSAHLLHESDGGKVELSKAMRDWVFSGQLDSINVKEEVWMPPLGVGGAE